MAFLGNEHFIQCLMLPGLCKSDINSTIMVLSTLLITLLLVKNLNSSQNRCEMWNGYACSWFLGNLIYSPRKVIKARYHTDANDQFCERMYQVATTAGKGTLLAPDGRVSSALLWEFRESTTAFCATNERAICSSLSMRKVIGISCSSSGKGEDDAITSTHAIPGAWYGRNRSQRRGDHKRLRWWSSSQRALGRLDDYHRVRRCRLCVTWRVVSSHLRQNERRCIFLSVIPGHTKVHALHKSLKATGGEELLSCGYCTGKSRWYPIIGKFCGHRWQQRCNWGNMDVFLIGKNTPNCVR